MAERCPRIRRRGLLGGVCALGVACLAKADETDAEAASMPPQENDLIAFAFGERAGQAIRPEDLTVGAAQVFGYAMDPVSGLVRDGTRLYQLVLIRLDPGWLSEPTEERSVEGIVAYSGVCTHTGCDIEDYDETTRRFQCPCHESQFDPSDGARVVGGPAPWPLAALPLKLVAGQLAVARAFEGRVGFQQPGGPGGQSPFGL